MVYYLNYLLWLLYILACFLSILRQSMPSNEMGWTICSSLQLGCGCMRGLFSGVPVSRCSKLGAPCEPGATAPGSALHLHHCAPPLTHPSLIQSID